MRNSLFFPSFRRLNVCIACTLALFAGTVSSEAVDYTWTYVGTTSNWNLPGAWGSTGGTYPNSSADNVTISGTGTMLINVSPTVGNFSTDANGTWIANGSATSGASTTLTITGTLSKTNTQLAIFRNNSNSQLSLNVNTILVSNGELSLGHRSNATQIQSVTAQYTTITGGILDLNVAGTANLGAITMSGGNIHLNTYSTASTQTIYASSLSGAGGTIDSTNGIANALATLEVSTAGVSSFNGVLKNGATTSPLSFTMAGTGLQILTGTSSYTGATKVSSGTLQIGNGTTGAISGSSAVTVGVDTTTSAVLALDLGNNSTFANNITTTAAGVVQSNLTSGTNTLSGTISGGGSLVKNGLGTLIVSGNNSYTGSTEVAKGTLKATSSTALGNSKEIKVDTGATLDLSSISAGFNVGTTQTLVANGTVQATTGISVNGELTGSGDISGLVSLGSGGTLSPGGDGTTGTLTLHTGLTLATNGGSEISFDLGSSQDLIRIDGGNLTGNSSGTTLINLNLLSGLESGSYTLIIWDGATGSFNADAFSLGEVTGLADGGSISFQVVGNELQAVIAVPEPQTWAAMLVGGLGLLVFSRRSVRRMSL
ncbi:MAG: autotransporter-associated beta strand repeat-containing protein [Chthoniobacteraceae bacterium]